MPLENQVHVYSVKSLFNIGTSSHEKILGLYGFRLKLSIKKEFLDKNSQRDTNTYKGRFNLIDIKDI